MSWLEPDRLKFSKRRAVRAAASVLMSLLFLLVFFLLTFYTEGGGGASAVVNVHGINGRRTRVPVPLPPPQLPSHSHRKLLEKQPAGGGGGEGGKEEANTSTTSIKLKPERIGARESCSKDDVVVYQGPTSPLPNGIPTYTVQIINLCVSKGCAVSRVHLSCGWFSSARLVNPTLFRRLNFDDCLVNDGMPIPRGGTVTFQYANTFHYPLAVSSVSCTTATATGRRHLPSPPRSR